MRALRRISPKPEEAQAEQRDCAWFRNLFAAAAAAENHIQRSIDALRAGGREIIELARLERDVIEGIRACEDGRAAVVRFSEDDAPKLPQLMPLLAPQVDSVGSSVPWPEVGMPVAIR